jgi:hypothetical protein
LWPPASSFPDQRFNRCGLLFRSSSDSSRSRFRRRGSQVPGPKFSLNDMIVSAPSSIRRAACARPQSAPSSREGGRSRARTCCRLSLADYKLQLLDFSEV